jgi:hypothetical protein
MRQVWDDRVTQDPAAGRVDLQDLLRHHRRTDPQIPDIDAWLHEEIKVLGPIREPRRKQVLKTQEDVGKIFQGETGVFPTSRGMEGLEAAEEFRKAEIVRQEGAFVENLLEMAVEAGAQGGRMRRAAGNGGKSVEGYGISRRERARAAPGMGKVGARSGRVSCGNVQPASATSTEGISAVCSGFEPLMDVNSRGGPCTGIKGVERHMSMIVAVGGSATECS